jgi:hypothetical protein
LRIFLEGFRSLKRRAALFELSSFHPPTISGRVLSSSRALPSRILSGQ